LGPEVEAGVRTPPGLGEQIVVNDAVPGEVVDRLLWRDAQDLLDHHVPADGRACRGCRQPWPCPSRRLAERAKGAAFGSWNEAWTARNDLNSVRVVPAARNPGFFPPQASYPPRTFHPR